MDFSKIHITDNNIHIVDSYLIAKEEMDIAFDYIKGLFPKNNVMCKRSRLSLKMEWITHNVFYKLHILRSHTKDVDLNYPLNPLICGLYDICGILFYLFVK